MPDQGTNNTVLEDGTMRFAFAQLEGVLAHVNRVPSERRTRFQARVRNVFRIGLKLGHGGVGGKRDNYEPLDLLKLALAVEYMQSGIMPEKAVILVNQSWQIFLKQMRNVWRAWVIGRDCSYYMVYIPSAMNDGAVTFAALSAQGLSDLLTSGHHGTTIRLVIIRTDVLLRAIERAVVEVGLDLVSFHRSLAIKMFACINAGADGAVPDQADNLVPNEILAQIDASERIIPRADHSIYYNHGDHS